MITNVADVAAVFTCIFYRPDLVKKSEAVTLRRSVKKVLLKILQNSQENTCARVSF